MWPALLEAERLAHELTASTSSSSARGSLTSVHVKVYTPLRSRNQRCMSSPPRIPLRASFRFTAAGFGTRIGNSLRNCRSGNATSHPGNAASLVASAWARLKLTSGWEVAFPDRQFLNEFPIRVPNPAAVNRKLARKGILGGLDMHRWFRDLKSVYTFTCTEVNDPRALDELVEAVSS